uniref:(northern house mosquito) hypothetical protein n=1 Tax=Culex pipiens TaxID=7175 RepID=A0A8D8CCP1_CULPI
MHEFTHHQRVEDALFCMDTKRSKGFNWRRRLEHCLRSVGGGWNTAAESEKGQGRALQGFQLHPKQVYTRRSAVGTLAGQGPHTELQSSLRSDIVTVYICNRKIEEKEEVGLNSKTHTKIVTSHTHTNTHSHPGWRFIRSSETGRFRAGENVR